MKKAVFFLFAFTLVLVAVGVPLPAYAHEHGGFRGSIWIGPGWGWWGPWSPYPYYAYPPVVVERQPPIYEEQVLPQEDQPYYWYFCKESNTYYPYVKHCPGGWTKVVPSPKSPPK